MGLFQGPSPKRHRVWSNDENMVQALITRAGTMPRNVMESFSTTLVNKYVDVLGVHRRVGKKKELRASQSLACISKHDHSTDAFLVTNTWA